jgi:PAS domain S-box-containing protein
VSADRPGPQPADLDRLRLAAIVESSDDAIVSKDLDGTIRSWNPAAERTFGWRADEMVGQSIFRIIPETLVAEEHALLARIAEGERVAHYDTSRVRKDGRVIRISLTLSPILDADGRLVGASSISRDVTSERDLEHRLQQAQRMETLGRLSGGIAHDFNNLLTVILAATDSLGRRLDADEAGRSEVEEIKAAADRAASVTRQLLALGRRQGGERRQIDVNLAIRDLSRLLGRLLDERVRVELALHPDTASIMGDPGEFEQILLNLVLNARDAMPDGGTMTIETANARLDASFAAERLALAPGEYVMLAVSDTGMGMDTLTQAHIFEPFFTTKPQGKGTGLGLATVFGIVQRNHGGIYVYSEPGRGSTFKVYLPRAQTPALGPPNASDAATRAPAGSETVLLVEDDAAVRRYTARALQSYGYTVLEAASGDEALQLMAARQEAPGLLLADVILPGMSGPDLIRRLRLRFPELPVLLMSGYAEEAARAQMKDWSIAFLPKPFTPDVLAQRITELLAPQRLARP